MRQDDVPVVVPIQGDRCTAFGSERESRQEAVGCRAEGGERRREVEGWKVAGETQAVVE